MKISKLLFFFVIAGLLLFSINSCDDYLGGNTNVDPNSVFEDDVSLNDMLAPIIVTTTDTHFNIAFTTSQYAQHTSFVGDTDKHEQSELTGAWTNIYLTSLNNLDVMEKKARDSDANHFLGIAHVLQAINLGLATNTWEDIPYSEAFTEGNFTPSYDSQESIYQEIQSLLDDAISSLQQPASEIIQPGSEDLIFNGDIDRWIRAANSLKARYHIHLTNKGAVDAANNALNALSNAMESNEDDVQVNYTSRNLNPWHTSAFLARQTGNPAPVHSDQIISSMNGTTYPEVDPRLPIIADNGGDSQFYGSVNGNFGINTQAQDNLSNTVFNGESWHTRDSSPILMITYAETKFIEAEAEFLVANSGSFQATGANAAAYEAYLEGIRANMDKLGVSQADRDAYLSDPNVAVGTANLTMELIMKEKYKALFLNPETFNDLRRYNFDDTIFRGLELPEDHNSVLNGQWIQRAVYPSSEFSRNEDQVRQAEKAIDQPMWFYN
ncbi:SusD/RagB family nutrient-binding outer membrane lipoprotein [Rhodohalobacter sp.]|uniref:SusD/RagB family nutrient-binding outer membrane lipoprotein n=2 Tax=Rhodohalobacter sp. TaxID=1974210 RepID=UPI003563CD5B